MVEQIKRQRQICSTTKERGWLIYVRPCVEVVWPGFILQIAPLITFTQGEYITRSVGGPVTLG